MAHNVEISPKWLQDFYYREASEDVSMEVINECKENGLVFVIEAVRAIDAFEVYNDLMCSKIFVQGVMQKHPYVYLKNSELVYAGQDGSLFSIAFKLKQ
ncbi:MAG: hypothetical protein IKG56_03535 [Clostridia bacterium]|nr:hypothetical protein [Clostridia bacterium]